VDVGPKEESTLAAVVRTRPAVASTRANTNRLYLALVAIWLVGMVVAQVMIWRFKNTPGAVHGTASVLPSDLGIPVRPGHDTLVMLAHPFCPCTRASIGELAALMSRVGDHVTAHVYFERPEGMPVGWERSDTWVRASQIPGVFVHVDPGGRIATRLGATVSGHTFLYDARGHRIFSGGITIARGHSGDNPGRTRIVSLVTGNTADRADSPTFGCAL
jgi:hypothetical protein